VLATVWLVQQGSTESKKVEQAGPESDEEQHVGRYAKARSPKWAKVGGLRRWLYSNSLLIVMGLIWLGSWFARPSRAGASTTQSRSSTSRRPCRVLARLCRHRRLLGGDAAELASEFLAVGTMAIFS